MAMDVRPLNVQCVLDKFQEWDLNGDGVISETELCEVLVKLGISRAEVHDIFSSADFNKDGSIDYSEFLEWVFGSAPDLVKDNMSATLTSKKSCIEFPATCQSIEWWLWSLCINILEGLDVRDTLHLSASAPAVRESLASSCGTTLKVVPDFKTDELYGFYPKKRHWFPRLEPRRILDTFTQKDTLSKMRSKLNGTWWPINRPYLFPDSSMHSPFFPPLEHMWISSHDDCDVLTMNGLWGYEMMKLHVVEDRIWKCEDDGDGTILRLMLNYDGGVELLQVHRDDEELKFIRGFQFKFTAKYRISELSLLQPYRDFFIFHHDSDIFDHQTPAPSEQTCAFEALLDALSYDLTTLTVAHAYNNSFSRRYVAPFETEFFSCALLCSCASLKELHLRSVGRICALGALGNSSLVKLVLSGLCIETFSGLSKCKTLQDLEISFCLGPALQDLSELVSLQSLNSLKLRKWQYRERPGFPTVISLMPLADSKISCIDLAGVSEVRNCEFLKSMPLTSLCLDGCPIENINDIRMCTALRSVSLSGWSDQGTVRDRRDTRMPPDFRPLVRLNHLEEIDISCWTTGRRWSDWFIDDISELNSCRLLRKINLDNTFVAQLWYLKNCSFLEEADLSGCWRPGLLELAACPKLSRLKLEQVIDMENHWRNWRYVGCQPHLATVYAKFRDSVKIKTDARSNAATLAAYSRLEGYTPGFQSDLLTAVGKPDDESTIQYVSSTEAELPTISRLRTLLPKHACSGSVNQDSLSALLALRAFPDCCDEGGRTPLWYAIMYRDAAAVQLLLEHGADPDLVPWDRSGLTPLSWAVYWGSLDVVNLLLRVHSTAESYKPWSVQRLNPGLDMQVMDFASHLPGRDEAKQTLGEAVRAL